EALKQPGLSFYELFVIAFEGYADRPLFGHRAYEVRRDPSSGRNVRELLPRFDTITYGDAHAKIKNVASAWRHSDQHSVKPGDFVCILGFTGADFTIVETAAWYT